IQRAIDTADKQTAVLAQRLEGRAQGIARATLLSQRAEIVARGGRPALEKAVQMQADAAEQFELYGRYSEGLEAHIAMCRFIDELVPDVSFQAALEASIKVLFRVESYSRGMGGQTLDAFLRRY